ncbi:hypothetical protein F0U59_07955 [Archangium gephyra]|nr:hypothetical protein F0U59_07955 [Archangium gephyra]
MTELRASRNALPAETPKTLGFGGSKVYNRLAARVLGQSLIDICADCADALGDPDTTLFNFKAKVTEIDALLNIQMITANKAQVQRLKTAAIALQNHCRTTGTIDKLDQLSTKADWAGERAIDIVLDALSRNPERLHAKTVAGRAQLIINNAGDSARVGDEGWNSSKRANVEDPLERVPEQSRDIVGMGKATSLDRDEAGFLAVCHGTAAGMLNIVGRKHRTYQAGGKGPVLREQARALAQQLLADANKLYLLHFKCTAQMDGHSFMLCMNHSGSVTRAESWANRTGNGLFLELQADKRRRNTAELTNQAARDAVEDIFSADADRRTRGYMVLAQAYDNSVLYEQRRHDEHAEDHECDDDCRADDDEISIVVTARQLTKPKTVKSRLDVLRSVYDAIPV